MSLLPTISASDLKQLRSLTGDQTIEVLFDGAEAERSGCPVWNIYYRMSKGGELLMLGEWRRTLDGYIGKLAENIKASAYAIRDEKVQNADFDRKSYDKRRNAMRIRDDMIRDATDYSYEAWKALVDGKASCGSTRAGCSGKA